MCDVDHHPRTGTGSGYHEDPHGQPPAHPEPEGRLALEAAGQRYLTEGGVATHVDEFAPVGWSVRRSAVVVGGRENRHGEPRTAAQGDGESGTGLGDVLGVGHAVAGHGPAGVDDEAVEALVSAGPDIDDEG